MSLDLHGYSLIVTGFPRSGTSMMMRMLEKGGVEVLYSQEFQEGGYINHNDPYGVLEVKDIGILLKENPKDWTMNKAVKLVTPLQEFYPFDRPLKVIFMQRDHAEIITSLLVKRDFWMMDIADSLASARKLLEQHETPTLYLHYHEVVKYPRTTSLRIEEFLDVPLDIESMSKGAEKSVREVIKKEESIISMNVEDYLPGEGRPIQYQEIRKGS